MGTSSSNSGPHNNTDLLPSWATGSDSSGLENNTSGEANTRNSQSVDSSKTSKSPSTGNWAGAKGALTRYANKTKGSSLKKAARSYIKTLGGSSKATKASIKGIIAGGAYADFISSISSNGYEDTLKRYGLENCIGKSSKEALALIADKIAPIGSTNDEAIARKAVLDSLDSLYEKLLSQGKEINTLESLDKGMLKDSVSEFVSIYIFKKWIYEVGIALEKNKLTEKEVILLEQDIKTFIRDEVKSVLKDKDIVKLNLSTGEGKKMIEDIFELAYSTIK